MQVALVGVPHRRDLVRVDGDDGLALRVDGGLGEHDRAAAGVGADLDDPAGAVGGDREVVEQAELAGRREAGGVGAALERGLEARVGLGEHDVLAVGVKAGAQAREGGVELRVQGSDGAEG